MGVWLVLTATVRPAAALDPRIGLTQFHTLTWQIENGLPQNSVQAVLQSRSGYLWLGTQAGLARFDGVRFVVFDRSNTPAFQRENVRALAEDRDGAIWIGTDSGVLRYRNERFTRLGTADGLPNEQVRSLLVDHRGVLWAGTLSGVCQIRNGKVDVSAAASGSPNQATLRIDESRDGTVWFATANGLYLYRQDHFERLGLADGLPDLVVFDVHQDRDGVVWIGTSRGLARMAGDRRIALSPLPVDDSVHTIWEDREGTLWLGLERRGIARVQKGRFEICGKAQGLAGNYAVDFLEDRHGNMWVGLFDAGLVCLRQTPFSGFGVREGLPSDDVQTILQSSDGTVWIGSNGGGLSATANGQVRTFTAKQGLADDIIMALGEDRDGTLWVGTPLGLSRIRRGRIETLPDPDHVLQGGVRAVAISAEGALWIGTNAGGLCALSGGRLQAVRLAGDPVSPGIQALLLARNGVLWVGGSRGLTRIQDGRAKTFTTADGLGDNFVLSLFEDEKGAIWAGTFGGGLNRVKDGIRTIAVREGLYDAAVFTILDDGAGNFWMSCNKGIYKVAKADLDAVADGRRGHLDSIGYGVADGLRGAEGNGGSQPCAWRMRDGHLWFAGIRGAVIVDPKPMVVAPPPPLLEQVSYDRRVVDPTNGMVLPPGSGQLEFQYTALDFRAPQGVQFRYRLEGFDSEWVDAGTRRTAFYTNVPPGSYAFHVSARNKDGSWNPRAATLAFRLRPHYYQAAWFYVLCIIVALLGATGIYGLRVRGMKARQRRLAHLVDKRTHALRVEIEGRRQTQIRLEEEIAERRQVQEELARAMARAEAANQAKGTFLANMSHEIRTPMNGILGMTELLLDTPMSADQRDQLDMVRGSAQSLLTVINDVLDFSKIDAGRLELESLAFGLRDLIDDTMRSFDVLASDRGLDLTWAVDESVPDTVIGDPGRIRQVLNNLLGNAIKFTEIGSVALRVSDLARHPHEVTLRLSVRDTGIGIPADKLTEVFEPFTQADESTTRRYGGTGLGLTITARLVRLMGGEIFVESLAGKGSTFSFTVRLGLVLAPSAQEVAPIAVPPPPSTVVAPEPLRVLVAEDNLVNQRLIGRLLQKWGHEVTIVSTGELAVEAVGRQQYDLVLMDVQMPGMDGFEATRIIRSQETPSGRHLPIVAITAHAMKGDRERCLAAGMDGYLSKPIESTQLRRVLDQSIHGRPSTIA
jgi:signal transduction histidine kinase/ligand-binding sensor domain-containing protein/ActR/RegA family two-component response regulator